MNIDETSHPLGVRAEQYVGISQEEGFQGSRRERLLARHTLGQCTYFMLNWRGTARYTAIIRVAAARHINDALNSTVHGTVTRSVSHRDGKIVGYGNKLDAAVNI